MDIADLERKLGIDGITAEQQMEIITALQQSAAEKIAKAKSESIGKGAELVIQGLKKIKSDMEQKFAQLNGEIQSKVTSVQDGQDGKNGKDGRDGKQGPAGATGPTGRDGVPGRDGVDGSDGTGVSAARIDFDGSLVITLDDGREINVGEVVPFDVAERIKVITNGGGTSQSVLDTLTSLQSQITAMSGFVNYEGTWNASTNTPTLVSSVGTKGDYYVVSVTGSTNLNGITTWTQGDWAIFNGTAWEKVDNTDLVTSVAGRTGAITLTTADISGLGTIATQAANNVSITGGSITGITDLAVADGGTGASNAGDARTNLGLVIGTDVLSPSGSAASLTSFPTFNQNTTGTASNVTGTVAVLNGGTGATTAGNALTNLGAYPSANPSGFTSNTGTVNSVAATAGTGISVTGSPITTSGTLTITNSAPDQTVALTAGTGISTSGTYPNFTITNSAPDQTVALTGAGTTSITGTYPNFTITSNDSATGTVTSVAATVPAFLSVSGSPVTTSGTLAITLSGTALPVANGGTGVTTSTGSGNNVLSTSPSLTTPVLGTPTSGTLDNCTVDGTDAVGFRNVPVNSQSAAYTLVLADSGKTILHPSGDANARTFTIPSNASVAYAIGTVVTFINMTSQVVTIAINTDTMNLSPAGTTGSRSLAQYGSATALKITSTNWLISGSGLT